MAYDWIGVVAFGGLVMMVLALISASRLPTSVKVLLYLGILLRGVGSIIRYRVLFDFYHGSGDAVRYYRGGLGVAEAFRAWDFSPIFDSSQWLYGKFIGTNFMNLASGGVLTFLGPHQFTEFIVFALLSFIGLYGFGVAFWRTYPRARPWPYLMWIWLFPSLWYWPSSIGKEALIIMGMGLAVMGFIGRRERMNWLLMGLGLLIVLVVRAEVAGVLLVSMLFAQWLSFRGRWTSAKIAQAVFFAVISLAGVGYAASSVGIDEFDLEAVEAYADPSLKTDRGTSVDAVGINPLGAPLAVINVLFRPFPWEASNVMVLISSLEILVLWGIVFYRRRAFVRSLRNWRSDRFLSLSIVFILLYSAALGMTLVNLGIIARQRVFLFPFVFLLLEAEPREKTQPRRAATRRRAPGRGSAPAPILTGARR